MTNKIDTKDSKIIGFWIKCIRETKKWSQEALAASSNLNVRTIQRIEAGDTASVNSLRSLARSLGYENPDVFENLEFIKNIQTILSNVQDEKIKKKFPDHILVKVSCVKSGEGLSELAYGTDACLFNADDMIAQEAKVISSNVFDFLRDIGDLGDLTSFSDKCKFQQTLDEMLKQLNHLNVSCYSAHRLVKMVDSNREYEAPISMNIGYLNIVPSNYNMTEMMIPRRVDF